LAAGANPLALAPPLPKRWAAPPPPSHPPPGWTGCAAKRLDAHLGHSAYIDGCQLDPWQCLGRTPTIAACLAKAVWHGPFAYRARKGRRANPVFQVLPTLALGYPRNPLELWPIFGLPGRDVTPLPKDRPSGPAYREISPCPRGHNMRRPPGPLPAWVRAPRIL
jgi:hypothetical protein